MIFLVLETLILSRFIDERHWPFSYPVDPKVEDDNVLLHNQLNQKDAKFLSKRQMQISGSFLLVCVLFPLKTTTLRASIKLYTISRQEEKRFHFGWKCSELVLGKGVFRTTTRPMVASNQA
jgi:hypothetical protein